MLATLGEVTVLVATVPRYTAKVTVPSPTRRALAKS